MVAAQYFPVVADFKSVIGQSVRGTVTFTPVLRSGDVILATTLDPRPASLVPQQVSGRIDADGRLKLRTKPDGVRQDAANLAGFPATGIASKYYVAGDTGKFYRWNGTSYYEILPYEPVRLLADTAVLELDSPLFYQVTFSGITVGDTRVPTKVTPFTFAAPNSSSVTVNLAEVGRQPGQPPGGITKIAPTAVRLVDDAKIQFSFDNQDIPDALDLNLQIGPNDVETLPDGRLQFKWNGNNIGDPVLLQLPSPTVFAARDYGVVSDGLAHNNWANLLDCVAQCVDAGGGVVRLDAGTTYVTAVLGATVTADSGRTYVNRGGIPVPENINIAFEGHEAEGLTILKLSAGVPRAFDFNPDVSGAQYKNIVIRNMTIDRSHITGTDLAPLSTVSSTTTIAGFQWATVPGLNPAQWANCTYAWSNGRNANFNVRIQGGAVQLQDLTGSSYTLNAGDQVQGSLMDSVIGSRIRNHAYANRILEFTIDNLVIENVISKLSPVILRTPVSISNTNGDTSPHIEFLIGYPSGSTPPGITKARVSNVRMTGGVSGVAFWSTTDTTIANAAATAITWYDDLLIENCRHDTLVAPQGNWGCSNFIVGGRSRKVRIKGCTGIGSGDVGIEIDNCWDFREEDNTFIDCHHAVFRTNFFVPSATSSGPTKTTLNNGSTLSASATSCTVTSLPSDIEVGRTGLVLIDSEMVWYRATSDDGLSWQLWRGLNGSTAATHASNATVTFVPLRGQRYQSVGTRIVKKASTPFGGTGYYGTQNNYLPMPPMQVRDPKVDFAGSNNAGAPTWYSQLGLCFDVDIQGTRYSYHGNTLAASSFAPSAMWLDEMTGNKVWDLAASGAPIPAPRIYMRNNIFTFSGAALTGSIYGLVTAGGWFRLDADIEVEAAHANASLLAMGALLGGSTSKIVFAPGSRLGVKMRNVLEKSVATSSSQYPTAFSVGSSANITLPGGMDVDLDLSEMVFGASTNDGNYMPYRIQNTAHYGLFRFNRIHHSTAATHNYAARKVPNRYITANYTVSQWDEIILVDTTAGAVTITLPKAVGGASSAGEPLQRGRVLRIVDAARTAGTNNITIQPNAADKIDGGAAGATVVLNTAGATRMLICQPGLPGWVTA